MNVLSPEQIEQFIEEGYTCLRGGFTRAQSVPVLEQMWTKLPEELGILRDDPATWMKEKVLATGGPTGPEVAALYTPRVRGAFDDLVGAGRWVERGERTGAWPFIFPGFHQTWQPAGDWHIDGGGQRTLCGPQQALIAIMLFSDIGPGCGGTALRVGSHKTSADVLRQAEPEGLTHSELIRQGVAASVGLPVVEAQGQIGDLVLCHGYLVHSSSRNIGTVPRIITNNCIALHEPMNIHRPDPRDYSPLEQSLRQ